MKFLIDTNPPKVQQLADELPDFVAGQLIVPAASRRNWGGVFALDNSAYVQFDARSFMRLQERQKQYAERCLFATCPDVPGDAKRTAEIWKRRDRFSSGFSLSLVLQNGAEDMDIPWDDTPAIFIGGRDPWKESQACLDLVRTAKILQKHVHCGRVNQIKRYRIYAEAGADTCDGSSIALHNSKLRAIAREFNKESPTLF